MSFPRAAHPAYEESLPHVTDILRDAGLIDTDWYTAEQRDRGSAVHIATSYLDEGDLDETSIDPKIRPRIDSYKKFLVEVRPEILHIEEPVKHQIYRFCGTADRILRINGQPGVLDLKGTTPCDWHGLQLAAYAECLASMQLIREFVSFRRWNLYLRDDGYKLIPRKDREDWPAFLAALTLRNWKEAHA